MVPIKSLTNGIVCPPFGYTMMKLKLVTNPSLKSHLVRNIYYYLVLQFLKPSGLVGWLVGWLVWINATFNNISGKYWRSVYYFLIFPLQPI